MKSISIPQLQELLSSVFPHWPVPEFGLNGLQVEGRKEVRNIATAVTASYEIIRRAQQEQIDALIVHHGLFWKGELNPVIGSRYRRLQALVQSGINLFAYHLPMDAHREIGNNWLAAKELGWSELMPFRDVGVIGKRKESSLADFVTELELYYGQPSRVAYGNSSNPVQSVALISGGAHRELEAAARAGCDAFVTGSADEPVWHLAKEEGIHFIAMGHAATERIGPRALATWLRERLPLPVVFFDEDNPF